MDLNHITPEVVRAAAYLETLGRVDNQFEPSGKTRGEVHCQPPNKRCGDRCIPPNWNCRKAGGGLDSHSKAVQFDPVGGSNNIIRGVKNVIEGTRKGDPEKLTRGIKGVERGVVKLTPGKTKEEKEKIRQRVKTVSAIAFATILTGVALHRTHRQLNRFDWYSNGIGQQIDLGARHAIDRVFDAWDAGVGHFGLNSMRTNRVLVRNTAAHQAERMVRQTELFNQTQKQLRGSLRGQRFIGQRAEHLARNPGNASFQQLSAIDAKARSEGWNQVRWQAEKAHALYSLRVGGLRNDLHSAFAQPAAHEYLARQWGFNTQLQGLRAQPAAEIFQTRELLRQAIGQTHDDLVADMRRRGIHSNAAGIGRYVDELIRENPRLVGTGVPGLTAPQRARMRREFTTQMTGILNATDRSKQVRLASETYNNAVTLYDNYFSRVADSISVNQQGHRYVSAGNLNSAAGVADYGLARFHHVQGTTHVRPTNVDSAQFLNNYYFHTRVQRRPGGPSDNTAYPFRSDRQALTTARHFNQNIRNINEARDWFRQNGFNVYIPQARQHFRPDASDDVGLPLRVQVYLQSRNDFRGSGDGQRCGRSWIPRGRKCHEATGPEAQKGSAQSTFAGNKHDTQYQVRRISSLVARVGAVAGGGVLAYVASRNAIKSHKALNGADFIENLKMAGTGGLISLLALKSLEREHITTYNSDQIVERYERLRKENGVEPETIDKIQKFVKTNSIDSQRVPTTYVLMGFGGYFDSIQPNRVHVSASSDMVISKAVKGQPAESYSRGVEKFMMYRAKANDNTLKAEDNEMNIKNQHLNFSGSHWIANQEGKVHYLLTHELGHAIHYRSNFASPKAVVVNGKRYEGDALQHELMRSSSYYGQSDLEPQKGDTENYYNQGNRLETFAENLALFVGNGRAMKEHFPVSHEWTKQTLDYALAQKQEVKPRPFVDAVKDISEGSHRFEPVLSRHHSRKDSEQDEATAMELLKQIRLAAIDGNVPAAMEVFAKAQALPHKYRLMLGCFMETAAMYSQLKSQSKK